MKNQVSKHISIAKHIVDGSLTIDSVKEFRGILRIFPNDPASTGCMRIFRLVKSH